MLRMRLHISRSRAQWEASLALPHGRLLRNGGEALFHEDGNCSRQSVTIHSNQEELACGEFARGHRDPERVQTNIWRTVFPCEFTVNEDDVRHNLRQRNEATIQELGVTNMHKLVYRVNVCTG